MSMCIETAKGVVNRCMEASTRVVEVAPDLHRNDNVAIFVMLVLFWGAVGYIWWQWQGKHERRILTGASRHFEREKEMENERVMKKIIERRLTKVTDNHRGGIFIAQVTQGKAKPRYFKFTQEMLAETVENIYYYLTESRTSIHEHKFTIETKRVFE